MNGQDIQDALAAITETLDEIGVPYALMGALSLSFYAAGRATHDVDVLIDGEPDTLAKVRGAAVRRGFAADEAWLENNPEIRDVNLRLIRAGIPVDVMLPRDAQDQSALTRRQQPVAARPFWVLAPEDIILQKLKIGRHHDFDDAIALFVTYQAQLDHDYLNRWALTLGVREELDYLWSQSKEIRP
jgi:hypothetical protein